MEHFPSIVGIPVVSMDPDTLIHMLHNSGKTACYIQYDDQAAI